MQTAPNANPMEHLLSNDEAAEVLGISRFSLRGKVLRRQIPFIKIGRRTLFSPSALRAFIESNSVCPRPRREAE
jgi:excisionase family DNA binding protein